MILIDASEDEHAVVNPSKVASHLAVPLAADDLAEFPARQAERSVRAERHANQRLVEDVVIYGEQHRSIRIARVAAFFRWVASSATSNGVAARRVAAA